MKLPSFKNRPFRMYLFLGLHLICVSLVIIAASLTRQNTLWMNDLASSFTNSIVNTFKGVKPVRPIDLVMGDHSHKFYSYLFDKDSNYKVFVSDSIHVEIKQIYPEGTDESLKDKRINIKASKGVDGHFSYEYDASKQQITIFGKKAIDNQYITLSIPQSDKSVTINFDVIDKQVPTKESIYLSNLSPKIGSSFYITSLFLEPYEDRIIEDGYHNSGTEDSVYGGVYYNALEKNGLFYSPTSEKRFRTYLDLSNHHYISDDNNIIIDEDNDIVQIKEGVTPGEHVISSTYGSSITFNVSNEVCTPISSSELIVKSTKGLVCPEQDDTTYIGQTIALENEDLKDHALITKSNDERVCLVNVKKSLKDGVFKCSNELMVRGAYAGECLIDVYYADNPSIKLNNHLIKCDTFSNHFNIDIDLLFDGVSFREQQLINNHLYRLEFKVKHRDTGEYEFPKNVAVTSIPNYYELTKIDNGVYDFKFIGSGKIPLNFSFRYNDVYSQNRFILRVTDPTKSQLSNVDPVSLRKVIGHALLHLFTTLFLVLFLYTYLEPKTKKDKLYILLFAGILALMLAILSEIIQLFVPGRLFGWHDIVIDYIGPSLITIVFLFLIFFKKPKEKEE